MYNVVFKNTSGSVSDGVIIWTVFKDKKDYEKWNDEKMRQWYKVIEEDVSQERAIELCSTPQAKMAGTLAELRRLSEILTARNTTR